ncbi:hypothetical protein [Arthrobacter sp. B3I4]|uniref:hypothetical protein n=1 Tax=Arthrobacter sp. B3I4 TaxID=3042267 RepID=UPI00278B1668|nr:hypothetical protein [Arthrobacter sp. B3I4]MDQ0756075.1 hypothetical protein [Arthrobacter sp. B3I4]
MAENDFIMAVDPGGNKRLVPAHYLDNPALGFKLPPSDRVKEPADTSGTSTVREPAAVNPTVEQVEEPAAAAPKTSKRTGAAGENEEAS